MLRCGHGFYSPRRLRRSSLFTAWLTTVRPSSSASSSSSSSSSAAACECAWRFSVEVSTPALKGPLLLHHSSRLHDKAQNQDEVPVITITTTSTADEARWAVFVTETLPQIAALNPLFVTIPCKEPYFVPSPPLPTPTSAGASPDTCEWLSTTQATVQTAAKHLKVPVMLTLSATIDPKAGLTLGSREQRRDADHFCDAVDAAVRDFVQCRGGAHVLAVRGDDYSRASGLNLSSPQPSTVTPGATPSPEQTVTSGIGHRAIVGSDVLLARVHRAMAKAGATDKSIIAMAGYPQGHITQRQWKPVTACTHSSDDSDGGESSRPVSFDSSFVDALDVQARRRVAVAPPDGNHTTTSPSHQLANRVAALERRVHLCRLVESLRTTPSVYSDATRWHNVRTELVEGKVAPCLRGTQPNCVAIMTQVGFEAEAFVAYQRDVLQAFHEVCSRATGTSSSARSLILAAGVLVPPVHDPSIAIASYTGLVLRLKVIPSAALSTAVQRYVTSIDVLLQQAHEDLSEAAAEALIRTLESRVQEEDDTFCATWWKETVALVEALITSAADERAKTPAHVHFFPLGPGPAAAANVARLVQEVTWRVRPRGSCGGCASTCV